MSGFLPRLFKRSNKHNRKEQYRALPIMRYLIYLVLATTITSGVSLSRFYTSSQAGDIARVAKFDVEITSEQFTNSFVLSVDRSAIVKFTVKNNSEVAVRVKVQNEATGGFFTPANSEEYSLFNKDNNKINEEVVNGWFILEPNGSYDDTRIIKATINGTFDQSGLYMSFSNNVRFRFVYEQID